MSYDHNRKLTPIQMEQFIIHLKSEIDKYKNKTEIYKRENHKSNLKELTERNLHLADELEALKEEMKAKDHELDQLKSQVQSQAKNEEKLRSRIQELQGVFSHLQTQEQIDKSQIHDLTLENAALKTEIDELKEQIAKYTSDNKKEKKKSLPISAADEEDIIAMPYGNVSPISSQGSQFTKGIVALNNTYTPANSTKGTEECDPLQKFLEKNPLYRERIGTSVNPFKKS